MANEVVIKTDLKRQFDLQVGMSMNDGTLYAGLSPETNEPLYVLPSDERICMHWREAAIYASEYEHNGNEKGAFRVPTLGELTVIFENLPSLANSNDMRYPHGDWYWSSTDGDNEYAYGRRFSDGLCAPRDKCDRSLIRLVRN